MTLTQRLFKAIQTLSGYTHKQIIAGDSTNPSKYLTGGKVASVETLQKFADANGMRLTGITVEQDGKQHQINIPEC